MNGGAALWLYLLASRLAGPVARPILTRRLKRGKEDPARLPERLGHPGLPRPGGRLAWLHAASVGEAVSALPLIRRLQGQPGITVLLTTGTVTSAARMARDLPDGVLHQFVPVDTRAAVHRFLDHWRPDLALWIESELWPRLIAATHSRGIPMAMINARLSARSAERWSKAPRMARALFGAFRTILTQDEETRARFASFGISARFTGNLKALVEMPPVDELHIEGLRPALEARKIWLAASTHPGEESIVAEAHATVRTVFDNALLILAPRHPDRGGEIAAMLRDRGMVVAQRSLGEAILAGTEIYLADTLGEMGLWYRCAPITLVGGSLADHGGHTPFEPVLMHSAVLHGPHVSNFSQAYDVLDREGASRVVTDAGTLADAVGGLFEDELLRRRLAARALDVHGILKPDLERIVEEALALMEPTR